MPEIRKATKGYNQVYGQTTQAKQTYKGKPIAFKVPIKKVVDPLRIIGRSADGDPIFAGITGRPGAWELNSNNTLTRPTAIMRSSGDLASEYERLRAILTPSRKYTIDDPVPNTERKDRSYSIL